MTFNETFLQKPYGGWDKIEKSVFVQVDEGSDNEHGKSVLENNTINDNYNVLSDNSESDEEVKEC